MKGQIPSVCFFHMPPVYRYRLVFKNFFQNKEQRPQSQHSLCQTKLVHFFLRRLVVAEKTSHFPPDGCPSCGALHKHHLLSLHATGQHGNVERHSSTSLDYAGFFSKHFSLCLKPTPLSGVVSIWSSCLVSAISSTRVHTGPGISDHFPLL